MIKAITGTKDILPSDIYKWKFLENQVIRIFENFNYKEIRTPTFEQTALFSRGIGEATDIVSKEMYTFTDRSENSITLKPEMTASVVRAFIEHSLGKQQNLNKLYYLSPMYRQERPQAGRYRQFHQFGAEALGSSHPKLDAEMIIMAYQILKAIGLNDLKVRINSLGLPAERENYKNNLRNYLEGKKDKLSDDSKKRLDTNILRVFDSKDENDQEIMSKAPVLLEHLGDDSLMHFEKAKKLLLAAGIQFYVEPALVRGLDYYTHTTFEIISGSVGSQDALCGGGRYDLLVEQLGGNPTAGVGFAAGIERILLAAEKEKVLKDFDEKIDVYIVTLDKELSQFSYETGLFFRERDFKVELDYLNRSVKAQMREANRLKAKVALMIGGEEFQEGKIIVKFMETGEQEFIHKNQLEKLLDKIEAV